MSDGAITVGVERDAEYIDWMAAKYSGDIGAGVGGAKFSIRDMSEWRALAAYESGVKSGVFVFLPDGDGVEIHTILDLRGKKAVSAMREAQAWVWGNTTATHISSYVFRDRPALWVFARASGFHKTGAGFTWGARELDRVKIERSGA